MQEMLMWDKYDNEYKTVVDIKEVKKLQAELEEIKQTANNDWKERCRLTFELQDLEEKIMLKDKIIDLLIQQIMFYDNHYGINNYTSEKECLEKFIKKVDEKNDNN